MLRQLALYLCKRVIARRAADLEIGGARDPYLQRWHLLPLNRFCNVYLHRMLRDDDDRALHDHPWANASWLLQGGYFEHLPAPIDQLRFELTGAPAMPGRVIWRAPGAIVIRPRGELAHRLSLQRDAGGRKVPAWSLFITGPKRRAWGFHCPRGWVWWREFTDGPQGELIGRGCDQGEDHFEARPAPQISATRDGGA